MNDLQTFNTSNVVKWRNIYVHDNLNEFEYLKKFNKNTKIDTSFPFLGRQKQHLEKPNLNF